MVGVAGSFIQMGKFCLCCLTWRTPIPCFLVRNLGVCILFHIDFFISLGFPVVLFVIGRFLCLYMWGVWFFSGIIELSGANVELRLAHFELRDTCLSSK